MLLRSDKITYAALVTVTAKNHRKPYGIERFRGEHQTLLAVPVAEALRR
jgi:hypothetical protein